MAARDADTWIFCSNAVNRGRDYFKFDNLYKTLTEQYTVIQEEDIETRKDLDLSKVKGIVLTVSEVYDRAFFDQFPNIKVVSMASRGFSNIDVPYLNSRGIAVGHLQEEMSDAVAEFAVTLLLATAKNLPDGLSLRKHDLPDAWIPIFGQNIHSKTIGILGLGSIGQHIAKIVSGFGSKVLYFDKFRCSPEVEAETKTEFRENVHDVLKEADFIIVAVPLNPQTAKMIGEAEFNIMKPNSVLVNIARGGVIDHDALVKALQNHKIRGAALDTTSPEPLPRDHPLLHMRNVLITPHMAWATQETKDHVASCCLRNLVAGLKGEQLLCPADP